MPLISVVMPAYNAGRYIREAIESVVGQTFCDWELIIVDDGSTDQTLKIIEEYAEQDKRIRYASIPNSGAARKPRSVAIKMSSGDWIVTLDADDFLEREGLGKLYQRVLDTRADIVLQRMVRFKEKGFPEYILPVAGFNMEQLMTGKEACAETIGEWKISAAGNLVKKELFARLFKLYPDELDLMNLDEVDTRRLFLSASKVAFCDTCYYYRIHPESITLKPSLKFFDILLTNRMLCTLLREHYETGGAVLERMNKQEALALISCRLSYLANRKSFKKEDHEIRERIKKIYSEVRKGQMRELSMMKKLCLMNGYPFFLIMTFLYSLFKNNGRRTKDILSPDI